MKGCVGNENFTQKTTFTIGEMLQKIVLNVDFTEKPIKSYLTNF